MFIFIGYFSRNRISCLTLSEITSSFTSIFGRRKKRSYNTKLTPSCQYKADGKKKEHPLKIPPSKISLFIKKALYIHGIKKSLFRGKTRLLLWKSRTPALTLCRVQSQHSASDWHSSQHPCINNTIRGSSALFSINCVLTSGDG
jgi:hypothetical protein